MNVAWGGSLHTDQQPETAGPGTSATPTPSPRDGWTPEPGGPYDVDDAAYHADRTALSSSGIRTLTKYCPARFLEERTNRRPDTEAFNFGHAAHMLVLGTGMPIAEIPHDEWRTKAAKEAVADARAAGAVPLKPKDASRVRAMAAKLRQHPEAGPLFARPGRAEQTFVARDPDTNELCKIRVDWSPDVPPGQRRLVVDYKTSDCAHPAAVEKDIASYGYDQQGAFYIDVLAWALQLDIQPAFVLVIQEKTPPYLVSVNWPEGYVIDGGRELNREAITTYASCVKSGVWPDYGPGPHRAGVPGWRAAAYEAAAQRRLARRDEELIGVPA